MRAILTLTATVLVACGDGTGTSVTAGGSTDAGTTSTGVPTTSVADTGDTAGDSAGSSSASGGIVTATTGVTGVTMTTGATIDGTTGAGGACAPVPAAAGPIAVDPACAGAPGEEVVDPWEFAVEWFHAAGDDVHVLPVVGPLTDDDGDGDVDGDDRPAIAFGVQDLRLVVLHGDGSPVFTLDGMHGSAGPTIADVDGDGAPEVVMITKDKAAVAVDGAGVIEWTSPVLAGLAKDPQVTVADLDADGDVEVIADSNILDGGTGAVIAALAVKGAYRTPVVADLDLDGSKEIVIHHQVFASTGAVLWEIVGGSGLEAFASLADIDGDPEAEVLINWGTTLYIREHDGAPIGQYPITGDDGVALFGPSCLADFDGDGQVEVALPAADTFSVMETDGVVLWQAGIQDASGAAGCSVFDLDGDGDLEILYADEHDFRVFAGATGEVLLVDPAHSSDTYIEYPVVADVDRDGSAEILVVSSGAQQGLTVYGHAGDGWSGAGVAWPVHDFAVTNVGQDGSVPPSPEPSWAAHNTFRARPTGDPPARPDLRVSVTDACVACAAGEVHVAYQVCNQGGVDVDVGVPLTLFALAGGVEVVVETRALPAVAAGACLAGDEFVFDEGLLVDGGVVARLYDDGMGSGPAGECAVGNDEASAEPTRC